MKTLVWFRGKDLRVSDHEPLLQASKKGEVIAVFVLDPYFFAPEKVKEMPHRMQFLFESLQSLKQNLAHLGAQLSILYGKSTEIICDLADKLAVDFVYAYRWSEPVGRKRDQIVSNRLGSRFVLFEGETLLPPGQICNQEGFPYRVYTPFSHAVMKALLSDSNGFKQGFGTPKLPSLSPHLSDFMKAYVSENRALFSCFEDLESYGVQKNGNLLSGGERAAKNRILDFRKRKLSSYGTARDVLPLDGTSRLSQDLKFGTLSVRRAWTSIQETIEGEGHPLSQAELFAFQRQILWREFGYMLLWNRPDLLHTPFRKEFQVFPWRKETLFEPDFAAWKNGLTGYPLIDAAARQLLNEGYVHNRARMISASFLTKHLLVPYWFGEAHYMKYLTDGDWALNNLGWQWSAGTGADAQPYFRVFHPVLQGKKYDPEGVYVKTHVPELRHLEAKWIHEPWKAPASALAKAGIQIGKTYPFPIVEHELARSRYLELAKTCIK